MQKTYWQSRTSCKKYWWFDYSRSKFSVKDVNLETIIDMQSCCKTWRPNGSSRIRAKQKLLKKLKGACKSSWSRRGSLKSFTLTIPWNLARLVKVFPGIIVRRHHTDRKHMGLLKAVRRVKEGTSAVLLQSGLDEKCWADSMEWYTFLRNVTDLFAVGKTPNERCFGEPFEVPIMPFSSLVEYHRISAKDQSRIHQFGKKVLPGLFLGYALYAGGICIGDIMEADVEELETIDASENLRKKTQSKGGNISKRKWKLYFSSRRWTNQPFRKRSGTENIHLDTGSPNTRRRSKWFSRRIRRVSATTASSRLISGCRWSDKWFLVHARKLHIPPSRWTQSQTLLAERGIIPFSTEIHWRLQNYADKHGSYARKPHRWLFEYRWIKRFVWFLDMCHSVYSIRSPEGDWQESS